MRDVVRMEVELVAGVDEVGRGPLFGPVYAAAVILDPARPIRGLRDSKQLTPERRAVLSERIRTRALAWHIAWADVEEIDALNILGATLLAMRRAVLGLAHRPHLVRVDGNRMPHLTDCCGRAETLVQGDAKVPAISAASILAKHARDELCMEMEAAYPGYQLASHKGYATPEHLEALGRLGPSRQHRTSFMPVSEALNRTKS
ncbi:MAG: ribonuclease HII [Steroidobacteraceae bacterium]